MFHVRQTLLRVRNHDTIGGDRKTRLIFQEPKTGPVPADHPLPEDIVEALKRHNAQQAQERLLMGQAYDDQGLVFCQANGHLSTPELHAAFRATADASRLAHISASMMAATRSPP